jgi:hypothetical protein
MAEVIFVKVRNDRGNTYDSYTDYWSLVDLSGFKTCELGEIVKDSDNIYIVSPVNGNSREAMNARAEHKCKFVMWQLERAPKDARINDVPPHFNEIWVSDRHYRQANMNLPIKYVILGGHKGLGCKCEMPKVYDFAHMSYLYGRREHLYNQIRYQGWSFAPNCWGADRDKALAASRLGLCLHQDETPIIEPLRYVLFACWKLPIVAEYSADYYPYKTYNLEQIRIATDWETNYANMTEKYTFKTCVEAAVNGVEL